MFGDDGPIQNRLRFPDECARHKLLDLVGDLALTGADLVGRISARRSGHQMNGQMADLILRSFGTTWPASSDSSSAIPKPIDGGQHAA